MHVNNILLFKNNAWEVEHEWKKLVDFIDLSLNLNGFYLNKLSFHQLWYEHVPVVAPEVLQIFFITSSWHQPNKTEHQNSLRLLLDDIVNWSLNTQLEWMKLVRFIVTLLKEGLWAYKLVQLRKLVVPCHVGDQWYSMRVTIEVQEKGMLLK